MLHPAITIETDVMLDPRLGCSLRDFGPPRVAIKDGSTVQEHGELTASTVKRDPAER
jgi:hypothetical protein